MRESVCVEDPCAILNTDTCTDECLLVSGMCVAHACTRLSGSTTCDSELGCMLENSYCVINPCGSHTESDCPEECVVDGDDCIPGPCTRTKGEDECPLGICQLFS
jgi:hypothetical protein